MPRTDIYLKIELDLPDSGPAAHKYADRPERLASEICRMIRKVYGVRSAEVSSIVDTES